MSTEDASGAEALGNMKSIYDTIADRHSYIDGRGLIMSSCAAPDFAQRLDGVDDGLYLSTRPRDSHSFDAPSMPHEHKPAHADDGESCQLFHY